jgi:Fic family protein
MSDKVTTIEELKNIKKALEHYPAGAFIEDIEQQIELKIPRRTLQRRLLALQNAGDLYIEGKTSATKYFLKGEQEAPVYVATIANEGIPLSKEGKEILQMVKQSLQQRKPVGYNRDFLDRYQANVSAYLTSAEMEKLEKIGKTATPNQPAGTYAKEILSRLLIDLSWNSSRLEGNTYSLLDTHRLISFGEMADDKSAREAQMILNHKDAIEFLTQSEEEVGFNRYTILNLHALLSNNLLPDPGASGRLRTFDVGIYKSVFVPLAVPQLISELFDVILEKTKQIKNPFEQAFFTMVHLPYLQPFDDVNKRVSRLAANIPFAHHNLSPLSFIDVPDDIYIQGMIGVYELNRVELLKDVFLWAYERSAARYAALRQSLGEPDTFRLKYREDIKELIANIISQGCKSKEASIMIKSRAMKLPTQDQEKFTESVETELLSLHEGNFARYQIRPSEFKSWKSMWLPSQKL